MSFEDESLILDEKGKRMDRKAKSGFTVSFGIQVFVPNEACTGNESTAWRM